MKRRLTLLRIALGYAVLFLTAAAGPVQAAFGESVDSVALGRMAHLCAWKRKDTKLRPSAPPRTRSLKSPADASTSEDFLPVFPAEGGQ